MARDAVQAMLDGASPGDVVALPGGSQPGNLIIRTADLTVAGAGDGTTLDGGGSGTVLTIAAPDVTVRNVTLINSGTGPIGEPAGLTVEPQGDRASIIDVTVARTYLGVTVRRAADVLLERVHVTGEGVITGEVHAVADDPHAQHGGQVAATRLRGDGVWVFDAPGTIVRDSVIDRTRDGIYLTYGSGAVLEGNVITGSRYGVHDMYAADVTIVDNELRGNLSGLVLMYGGPVLVEGNSVLDSGSATTGFGVLIKDAGGVTLRDCVLVDNRVGLHVDDAGRTGGDPTLVERTTFAMNRIGVVLYPSADVTFTGNAFVENTTQVTLGGSGRTQARWSLGGVGNHWSDDGGFDADGDGVGDVAYVRSGRVSELVARDPLLLALASGPAFRLLSAVEDRWMPGDPVVHDPAPLMRSSAPVLRAADAGVPALAVIGGAVFTLSVVAVGRGRRRRVRR